MYLAFLKPACSGAEDIVGGSGNVTFIEVDIAFGIAGEHSVLIAEQAAAAHDYTGSLGVQCDSLSDTSCRVLDRQILDGDVIAADKHGVGAECAHLLDFLSVEYLRHAGCLAPCDYGVVGTGTLEGNIAFP